MVTKAYGVHPQTKRKKIVKATLAILISTLRPASSLLAVRDLTFIFLAWSDSIRSWRRTWEGKGLSSSDHQQLEEVHCGPSHRRTRDRYLHPSVDRNSCRQNCEVYVLVVEHSLGRCRSIGSFHRKQFYISCFGFFLLVVLIGSS